MGHLLGMEGEYASYLCAAGRVRLLVSLVCVPVSDGTHFVEQFAEIGIWLLCYESGETYAHLRAVVAAQYGTILHEGYAAAEACGAHGGASACNASSDYNKIIRYDPFRSPPDGCQPLPQPCHVF